MSINLKGMQILNQKNETIGDVVKTIFTKIAPFWPLQNLIAVNPLQGLEGLSIEEALKIGAAYFEQSDLPHDMLLVNTETIKWLGIYCDEGQATITMPLRENGIYNAWRLLAPYDKKLHGNRKEKIAFLKKLPATPDQAISECLIKLNIKEEEKQEFLTLLLTTLPGWASYIKYKAEWSASKHSNPYNITQLEYLAVRIVITTLLWPGAKTLLHLHKKALEDSKAKTLKKIEAAENSYRIPLLRKIASQKIQIPHTPEAQLVFCIDVRSEPFRKSLESTGDYQTLGFAGFFGIPVQITDKIAGTSYSSCPVLLKPKHEVFEATYSSDEGLKYKSNYELMQSIKRLYQSLKYNFTTPFALVETLGGFSGIWMGIRTISPRLTYKISSIFDHNTNIKKCLEPSIDCMSLQEKYTYAENALRMIGLTDNFAPIIVFCGHGSSTQNNAYSSALDCGACGGRHGGSNAKILAKIMNCSEVRMQLSRNGIKIPEATKFFAAEHNTTTDEVIIFCKEEKPEIQKLKHNLEKALSINNIARLKKLGAKNFKADSAMIRANDWAEVRPEWGLARNAAFIIAPRDLTSALDLDGRCFLHSYDYKKDPQGSFLTTILTAPMIVAHWINMQYLFSTINNVAYGGGSKITKNITGRFAVMQGNASDLMNGLPLQSVYQSDTEPYHEPQRLFVVVLAPQIMLDNIIQGQPILQKLFGNGWVQMARIDPKNNKIYLLNRGFSWQEMS